MSKQEQRIFWTSFALTLLFIGFIAAFLLVDANSSRRERGSDDQLWSVVQTAPESYQLTLLGWEYDVSLAPVRGLDNVYTHLAPLLVPRGIYALGEACDYGVYWSNEFYNKYKESVYQQEVGSFSGRRLPPDT